MSAALRPYQTAAISAALAALEVQRSALIVHATGCGKTVLMAHLAEAFAKRGQRVLVIAHREELLIQARTKISAWTGLKIGMERAGEKAKRTTAAASRDFIHLHQPIVVASIQTLSQPNRLATWAPDEFGLVMVDESHHALAGSYLRVLEHFAGAKVIGVTATPDRGDDLALGQVFESVAHSYGIREAIDDGFLSPIRQHAVIVEGLDFSKCRTTAGDLNGGDLDRIMREEEHLHAVADPIFQLAGDRPTLTFASSVEHATLLADQLNRRAGGENTPKSARALSGETPAEERASTLVAFSRGEFQHLVNCALFLEGYDEPRISCVAVARPTKSRALYAQMLGRGTRLSPETGKADCLVIDFVGNAGRHSLISPLDIFEGDMTPPEREAAEEIRKECPGVTMEELLERAKAKVAAEEAHKLFLLNRAKVLAEAIMHTREVDAFKRAERQERARRIRRSRSSAEPPPTSIQVKNCASLGIEPPRTMREANLALIAAMRAKRGEVTT